MNEIIPIEITYMTSVEKWKGIQRFAKLNGFVTEKIDAMVDHIEGRRDASLDSPVTFKISNKVDFCESIYSSYTHPCPHCLRYSCTECPLNDDSSECCKAWHKVKKQMENMENIENTG